MTDPYVWIVYAKKNWGILTVNVTIILHTYMDPSWEIYIFLIYTLKKSTIGYQTR